MSQQIAIKLEKALISYLQQFQAASEPLAAATLFEGHGALDMDVLPRVVVTCVAAGGALVTDGIYECQVEILPVSSSEDALGQAARHDAILGIFAFDQLPAIQAALNKPESGSDSREVTGFGLSSIFFVDQKEGRDEEKNQHGASLNFTAWCHLEAD